MADDDLVFSAQLIGEDGRLHEIASETDVGRSSNCAITIDDAKVSRAHATLTTDAQQVFVQDHGSSNGTRVNQLLIDKPTQLYDGDTLCFEKHCFKVVIRGAAADMDATIVEDDATVVTMPEEPSQPAAGNFDLPGSWVDSGTGEETRVLSMEDGAAGTGDINEVARASDLAHLIVIGEGDAQAAVFELQLGGTEDPDVWEIGREARCEIQLAEPSVSARHAQLVHEGGRWRLVNLVSANGIYVNDDKRLTAFLSAGDRIRLGTVTLVFHAAVGAVVQAPTPAAEPLTAPSSGTGGGRLLKPLLIAAAVALLALATWQVMANFLP